MFYVEAPKPSNSWPILFSDENIWATVALGMFFYSVQISTDKNLLHFDIYLAVGSR